MILFWVKTVDLSYYTYSDVISLLQVGGLIKIEKLAKLFNHTYIKVKLKKYIY